jgi:hypothetical protein
MFSVRGDGLTTVTTDKSGVTAVLAQASNSAYTGIVLQSKSTVAAGSAGFYLFKVGNLNSSLFGIKYRSHDMRFLRAVIVGARLVQWRLTSL